MKVIAEGGNSAPIENKFVIDLTVDHSNENEKWNFKENCMGLPERIIAGILLRDFPTVAYCGI